MWFDPTYFNYTTDKVLIFRFDKKSMSNQISKFKFKTTRPYTVSAVKRYCSLVSHSNDGVGNTCYQIIVAAYFTVVVSRNEQPTPEVDTNSPSASYDSLFEVPFTVVLSS